jgi:hypothetical protein
MIGAHTLTRHQDIRDWAARRSGMPAIARIPDQNGMMQHRLLLRFGRQAGEDDASPVSWKAWLAELDRQQLALRVSPDEQPSYELIARRDLN